MTRTCIDADTWLIGTPRAVQRRRAGREARRLDPAAALTAMRRSVAMGRSSLARLGRLLVDAGLSTPGSTTSAAQLWHALERAMERGSLIVTEARPERSALGHEPRSLTTPVAAPREAPPIAALGHRLALCIVEDDGRPLPGLAVELGGDQAFSDGGGQAGFEVDRPGRHGLRLSALDEADWSRERPSPGPWPWPEEDDDAARAVFIDLGLDGRRLASPPASASAGGEAEATVELGVDLGPLNWVVLGRPILRRLVPEQLRCDDASALLVPAPWTDHAHPLAALVQACLALHEDPDRWLLIVGHASASGSAAANQTLSERRAELARVLLDGDERRFVAIARDHGSLRDVIAYLAYLGERRAWSCVCDQPPAQWRRDESEDSRALVEAFQADYNDRFDAALVLDGVCGPRTLAAIFAVLRDELARWLDKFGLSLGDIPLSRIVTAGYASTLAGRGGPADDPGAGDRLVELLLVERLPLDPEPELALVYDSRVPRRLELELPDEPNDWTTGPFTIVSDLTPEEPAAPERYRLSADDGWSCETVLPDEGVVNVNGELTIRYPELSTARRYTLVVIAEDGSESEIFADLRYGQLHRSASAPNS
ncbi:hypothetical protein G6O69_07490 [Pseudenhygromyxa sp. WMMC2535]|uniref:hypothetical protein n=1 Tax=Pseudenhygromyxa sp. WMMC2535 TaxID=2712867 RepID=UPI0015582038|nr:hypothetical protein [Pseudenhygromyxa sp. WMMC2535]NVB37671.1 hypothetical protein [Pseudenhygromyxa sp. WMMC2535]